jgi:hypothetical protein
LQINNYSKQLDDYNHTLQTYNRQLSDLLQNKSLQRDKVKMTNSISNISTLTKNIDNVQTKFNLTEDKINHIAATANHLTTNETKFLQNITQNVNNLKGNLIRILNNLNESQSQSADLVDRSFFDYFIDHLQTTVKVLDSAKNNFTIYINNQTLREPSPNVNLRYTLDPLIKSGFANQRILRTNIIRNATSELINRFKNFEAPIVGKLPIGFSEMIAIFPFAVTLGFCFCSSILCDTLRLGRHLYDAEKLKDRISSYEYISIVAPSWIDPMKPLLSQIISLSMLIIPVIIFVISIYSITSIWWNFIVLSDAFPAFAAARNLNEYIYLGLYGASVVLFIYCYWKIITEFRHASSSIPKAVMTKYRHIQNELMELLEKDPQRAYALLKQIRETKTIYHAKDQTVRHEDTENERFKKDVSENNKKR